MKNTETGSSYSTTFYKIDSCPKCNNSFVCSGDALTNKRMWIAKRKCYVTSSQKYAICPHCGTNVWVSKEKQITEDEYKRFITP